MQPRFRFLVAAFAVLAACGGKAASPHGSPVGTYELDKAAFREVILASLPDDRRKLPEEIAKVDKTVESMTMSIELKADGVAAFRMTAMQGERPVDQTATGTWTIDGDRLTITAMQSGHADVRAATFDGTSFLVEQATPTGRVAMTFRRR